MEVSKISEKSVKIKSKLATIGISPFETKDKLDLNVALFFRISDVNNSALKKAHEMLIINGPGEYEVKGIKLSGIGKTGAIAYFGKIDGIDIFVIQGSMISKARDILRDCQIAIVEADIVLDENTIAGFNANVVILYGVCAQDTIKALGEKTNTVSKYSVTREKLPAEMELILLA